MNKKTITIADIKKAFEFYQDDYMNGMITIGYYHHQLYMEGIDVVSQHSNYVSFNCNLELDGQIHNDVSLDYLVSTKKVQVVI